MRNLREFVRACTGDTIDSYGEIVREERFFCAVLFHLLLADRSMLRRFLGHCKVENAEQLDLAKARVFVEYAMARDLWNKMGKRKKENEKGNSCKAQFVGKWVPGLKSKLPEDFSSEAIWDFNERIVSARASADYIQSPARWNITKICKLFEGDCKSIKAACKLKWAFNVKPDIVIELGNESVVCVEAKVESGEGKYPTGSEDIKALESVFEKGKRWNQTTIQQFLMEEVLGFKSVYPVFLGMKLLEEHVSVTWHDIFKDVAEGEPTVNAAKKQIENWKKG